MGIRNPLPFLPLPAPHTKKWKRFLFIHSLRAKQGAKGEESPRAVGSEVCHLTHSVHTFLVAAWLSHRHTLVSSRSLAHHADGRNIFSRGVNVCRHPECPSVRKPPKCLSPGSPPPAVTVKLGRGQDAQMWKSVLGVTG